MKIKVLEEDKNRIKFEIQGEDHTLCNALRKALWQVQGIEVSGYNIEHPLVSEPVMIIETSGKLTPRDALKKAIENLKGFNKDLLAKIG